MAESGRFETGDRSRTSPCRHPNLDCPGAGEGFARCRRRQPGGTEPCADGVRDWVVKFNAHGSEGLIDRKAPGRPARLNDTHRAALAEIIESGPMPAIHGAVRWRLIDLAQWVFDEFRVSISKQTLSRELRNLGFRKLSARPRHHAKDEEAAAEFKKILRHHGGDSRKRGSWQAGRDLVSR
jgi:transposase